MYDGSRVFTQMAGRLERDEWDKVSCLNSLIAYLAAAKDDAAIALDPGVGFECGLVVPDSDCHADCACCVGEEHLGEERPSQAGGPAAGESRRSRLERPEQASFV